VHVRVASRRRLTRSRLFPPPRRPAGPAAERVRPRATPLSAVSSVAVSPVPTFSCGLLALPDQVSPSLSVRARTCVRVARAVWCAL
jgi:hypothetical protein